MDKKELAKLMVKEECTSDMKVSDVFKRTNEIYTELGGKGSVYPSVDITESRLVEGLQNNKEAILAYCLGSSFRYSYLTLHNTHQLSTHDITIVATTIDALREFKLDYLLLDGLPEDYLDYLQSKGIKVC